MSDGRISRRRLLGAIGATGATVVAGCTGDDPTTPTRTPTVTDTPQGGRCPDAEYVLNTGYDQDAGTTITPCTPDDDWEVADEDVSAGTVPRAADVIDPHPAWPAPFADSQWISVACDGDPGLSGNDEAFEYTYCFCLNEGFRDPKLDIKLRADDRIADIRLNGHSLAYSGSGNFGGEPIEETYTSRRLFQAGENCLTVVVEDTYAVITGLNLAGTVTATNGECCSGTCDLGIEKTYAEPFEFGGTGTYVLEVCNEGDGDCNRAAEVHDELPPGVTFDSATGTGWNVTVTGSGEVKATHPNQNGLAPGECLPPLEVHVDVAPLAEFPDGEAVANCADLITGGEHPDNDRDCTRPCVAGERTFEGGVHDGFDTSNNEPVSPSDGLATHLQNPKGIREFDEGGVDKPFGHTFDDLRPAAAGDICEAKLEICLRPEGSSLDVNDRIRLGVWDDNGNAIDTHWSRHLGNYDGKPGIFDTRWHADWGSTGETRCITLDLSELPEEDGSTTDLLPELNTHDRVSLKVQDDTAVDYAHLTVTYCCEDAEDDGNDGHGDDGDDGDEGHCDLSIRKHVDESFEFGEEGIYRFEVCNEGDGPCKHEVFEITDDLPEGFRFADGRGQGWRFENVARDRNRVLARHDGGLGPDECLPPVYVRVEVPPEDEWPHETNRVRNCVELSTDEGAAGEDCIVHRVR
jgi:uncharacterized repeat protein (TIGR01451 family)